MKIILLCLLASCVTETTTPIAEVFITKKSECCWLWPQGDDAITECALDYVEPGTCETLRCHHSGYDAMDSLCVPQ